MHKNVWVLTIAQAFLMSLNSLNVFVGGIVGSSLAPNAKLATIPVASIVVGTAVSTLLVVNIMKKIGRKRTFLSVAVYGAIVSMLAALAIHQSNFYFFCFCTFLLGVPSATLMQFRFASMESVSADLIPKAASVVLIGGIAAAFIGPEVAVFGKDLLPVAFSGSYLLLAVLFAIGFLILLQYQNTIITTSSTSASQRSLKQIAQQPVFWVAVMGATIGYAVMTFIMTATPVSMHVMDGHSLSDTKWVIQSHIVAMFLPSIFTGWLIKRLGIGKMMVFGLVIYLGCIAIAYTGHHLHNYWYSLILLGLGWNFLFVGGTALLPQAYTANERFKVQAMNEFIVFGTQAIASISAGWIVFSLGWESLLLITIPVIFIQLFILAYWKRTSKDESKSIESV
jgi:MFS family permease